MAIASVLFGFSFYALISWIEQGQLSDVPVYIHYAGLMRHGAVPYRDFKFEYPPAALPPMLLPSYMSWSYAASFAVLMGVCGAACIAVSASALSAVGASAARTSICARGLESRQAATNREGSSERSLCTGVRRIRPARGASE